MKIIILCLLLLLFISVDAQKPPSEKELTEIAIEKVLSNFSVALATDDTVSLKHLTGPTFVLLEEGRTYDFQAMILSIQQVFATGAKMKRLPSDFHTQIRGSVAWSTYRVIGEFKSSQGKVLLSLIEAAILENDGEQWHIVQMTSMPGADK
jgi:hypothetical protein